MQPSRPVILVVDHATAVRDLLVDLLQLEGYAVASTTGGSAALGRVDDGGIALGLVGQRLPDMDGLDLCRSLPARKGEAAPPIIMLTAAPSPQERQAALAAGATDYLEKPFNVSDLLDHIRMRLGEGPHSSSYMSTLGVQNAGDGLNPTEPRSTVTSGGTT